MNLTSASQFFIAEHIIASVGYHLLRVRMILEDAGVAERENPGSRRQRLDKFRCSQRLNQNNSFPLRKAAGRPGSFPSGISLPEMPFLSHLMTSSVCVLEVKSTLTNPPPPASHLALTSLCYF